MRITSIAFRGLAVAAACIAIARPSVAQQNPERVTVPLSDPSKPGTVKVSVMSGTITVKAANRKDVLVETRGRSTIPAPPPGDAPPGLKRLTQPGGFSLTEQNNELTISSAFGRTVDLDIQVPTRTDLKLSSINGGDIVVDGVEGDVEVSNVNGPITLSNIAGTVMAHSINGAVKATLIRAAPDKAMAFTSMNGHVDVTLPASMKANLKLRSDRGDVFTDFDVQIRQSSAPASDRPRRGGQFRLDVNKEIYGTINGGGQEVELRTFNGNVYVRKRP